MDDISLFHEARAVFAQGGNVTQHFKQKKLSASEQIKVIEFAYDLQSGSYTDAITADENVRSNKQRWGARISRQLAKYGISSAIEAGVGEASTLRFVVDNSAAEFAGFDISLSRLSYARQFLQPFASDVKLFTGDLAAIPVTDNAYDAVLSNHSLESNGGREREILSEMLRISRRYLILIEPDYEFASDMQKRRMDSFGYVRGLRSHLATLGARLICDEPWDLNLNPLNAASLIIAEKTPAESWNAPVGRPLASPYSGELLERRNGYLYARNDGVAFPVIDGFPCLLRNQGIIATHLSYQAASEPTIKLAA